MNLYATQSELAATCEKLQKATVIIPIYLKNKVILIRFNKIHHEFFFVEIVHRKGRYVAKIRKTVKCSA